MIYVTGFYCSSKSSESFCTEEQQQWLSAGGTGCCTQPVILHSIHWLRYHCWSLSNHIQCICRHNHALPHWRFTPKWNDKCQHYTKAAVSASRPLGNALGVGNMTSLFWQWRRQRDSFRPLRFQPRGLEMPGTATFSVLNPHAHVNNISGGSCQFMWKVCTTVACNPIGNTMTFKPVWPAFLSQSLLDSSHLCMKDAWAEYKHTQGQTACWLECSQSNNPTYRRFTHKTQQTIDLPPLNHFKGNSVVVFNLAIASHIDFSDTMLAQQEKFLRNKMSLARFTCCTNDSVNWTLSSLSSTVISPSHRFSCYPEAAKRGLFSKIFHKEASQITKRQRRNAEARKKEIPFTNKAWHIFCFLLVSRNSVEEECMHSNTHMMTQSQRFFVAPTLGSISVLDCNQMLWWCHPTKSYWSIFLGNLANHKIALWNFLEQVTSQTMWQWQKIIMKDLKMPEDTRRHSPAIVTE